MKLIMAIVSGDDSNAVSNALTKAKYYVTKLATTGGFLSSGNTTFLVGVNDEQVDDVISIIGKHSKKRKQMIQNNNTEVGMFSAFPIEVNVGGATVFVLNVEKFVKA